jgi:hypothetical protein
MTSRDFCFWLQGFFELSANQSPEAFPLSREQVRDIKNHLAMVFIHEIDPSMGPPERQAALNEAHAVTVPPIHGRPDPLNPGTLYRC